MRSVRNCLSLLAVLGGAASYGYGLRASARATVKQSCNDYVSTTCDSWYIQICREYCDLYHDQTVYCGEGVQKDINALLRCMRPKAPNCFTKESQPPPTLPNPQEPEEPGEPPELSEEDGYIEFDGPKGLNGECVWPYISRNYQANEYSGIGQDVYKAAYYCNTNQKPPLDPCWHADSTCVGQAPVLLDDAGAVAAAGPSEDPVFLLQPWNAYAISMVQSYETEVEAMKKQPLAEVYRKNIRVLTSEKVELITLGGKENPDNVKTVERIFSLSMLEKLFPVRHSTYSYLNLLKAVGAFPQICQTYKDSRDSDTQCLKTLATIFTHVVYDTNAGSDTMTLGSQENTENWNPGALEHYNKEDVLTAGQVGLYINMEQGFDESMTTSSYEDCEDSASTYPPGLFYPCHKGVAYFGRGAAMIRGNQEYGKFSLDVYGDVKVLLDDPSVVASTWLGFGSIFWKFLVPSTPIPSMLWSQDGTWQPNSSDQSQARLPGFGVTIQAVDKGAMCRSPSNPAHLQRTHTYVDIALFLSVDIMGEKLTCGDMQPFTDSSAAATKFYWTRDTSGAEKCMLGSSETPFSIGRLGDYKRCVDYHNRSFVVHKGKVVRKNGAKV